MTVYVHQLEAQSRGFFGQNTTDPWFVLTADADDELHAFAASLGLTPVMFRPGTSDGPHRKPVAAHYDLTLGERDRAVEHSRSRRERQPITPGEADSMERQRAAGLG